MANVLTSVFNSAVVLQDALRQQRDAAQKWVAQESKELELAAQAHLEGNVVTLRCVYQAIQLSNSANALMTNRVSGLCYTLLRTVQQAYCAFSTHCCSFAPLTHCALCAAQVRHMLQRPTSATAISQHMHTGRATALHRRCCDRRESTTCQHDSVTSRS